MNSFSEDWIRRTDEQLSAQKVPVKGRPWAAWAEWSKQTGLPSMIDSPEASAIFEWYTRNYPKGTFAFGSFFVGALYFDQAIWRLEVPHMLGTVSICLNDMIDGMPEVVQARMARDSTALSGFIGVAADSIDYALGFSDLEQVQLPSELAQNLLLSGDKELRSCVEVLLSDRPTQKSAESARMATEMFLKCYLAHHASMDEKPLREIGHNLEEALRQCLQVDPQSDLKALQTQLGIFPSIDDRYAPRDRTLEQLWIAYSLAQTAGTSMVRSVTDRDIRASIKVAGA